MRSHWSKEEGKRKSDGSKTETVRETAESFLKEFIPRDDEPTTFDHIKVGRIDVNLTEEEVNQAIWRMVLNKASGMDGITAGVLRKAWRVVGAHFTRVMKKCLSQSTFPDG